MSTTPLLQVVIYNPETFERASSAASYAAACLQTALTEIGRGHGTIMSGGIIGRDALGNSNVSLGEWNFTPGPALPP
jgi:hypothetical protein